MYDDFDEISFAVNVDGVEQDQHSDYDSDTSMDDESWDV